MNLGLKPRPWIRTIGKSRAVYHDDDKGALMNVQVSIAPVMQRSHGVAVVVFA